MEPNQEQVISTVRWVVTALGAWAVGRGYMASSDIPTIVGAVVALVPLAWLLITKTNANRVKSTSGIQGVTVVIEPNANFELKQLASDSALPNIVHRATA